MTTQTANATAAHVRPKTQIRYGKWFGWFMVRFTLIAICVLWTLPTFGLFVTSFRNAEAINASGWWTALAPSEYRLSSSVAIPADELQTETDGVYTVEGNMLDLAVAQGLLDAGDTSHIFRFGISRTQGANTESGITLDDERRNLSLTVNDDGRFVLTSPEAFDDSLNVFLAVKLPVGFTSENYNAVLEGKDVTTGEPIPNVDLGTAFINTFAVTIPSTFIPISVAAFAAYAFSWMTFPGRRWLFIIVVALLVVPLQMALIPLQRIYGDIGLKDTYPGVWLAHTGFGLPMAIYLLRNYIGGLPRELIESAQIDGASHYQIFLRLVFPLSIPALASFAIFQFLWVWNDLLVARVFLGIRPENRVLTAQIQSMTGTYGNDWHLMTAAAFVSIIVPLIVFFSLQRYFVRGLLAGSVKGG